MPSPWDSVVWYSVGCRSPNSTGEDPKWQQKTLAETRAEVAVILSATLLPAT